MALSDIPGLGAYYQRRQMNEQAPLADLQQVTAVQGLLANMQKQQQAQMAAAKMQQYEAELAALGANATPEARINLAAKYVGPKEVLTVQQGALDRKAQRDVLVQSAADRRDQNKALIDARYDQMSMTAVNEGQKRALDARRVEEKASADRRHDETLRMIGAGNLELKREIARTAKPPAAPSGYRFKADGSMEAIPGGPADAKAQSAEGGRRQITEVVDSLAANYDKLQKMGALVDPKRSAVKNIYERAAASGPGQLIAGAVGTEAQQIRDQINQARPLLMTAIKQATGMSSQMLNSNVELQFYLQAATDPSKGYETNRAALWKLDKTYGLGTGITKPKDEVLRQLEATAPRTQASGTAAGVPEGVDPAVWAVMTPQEKALWAK